MPTYTAVFEDTSPFLTCHGNCRAGTSRDDFMDQYSESSFTIIEPGSDVSFSFYGTEYGIYGARRGNHGFFQVSVDGTVATSQTGRSSSDQFNATLFSQKLAKGFHRVQLRNTDTGFRDIDYFSWEASVGNDNEPLIVNAVQDSHPAWKYTPPQAWTTQPPDVATFSGGSGRGTNVIGAKASLTFQGDAIAIFGPSGPRCASQYAVSVDGQTGGETFRAERQFFRARQLLYYAGNLGPGVHVVEVTLGAISSSQPFQMLALDYAEIYTTPSLGGSFSGLEGTSTSTPTGLFVGLGITTAVSILALAFLAYIVYLFKTGRIRKTASDLDQHTSTDIVNLADIPHHYGVDPMLTSPAAPHSARPHYQPSLAHRNISMSGHSYGQSQGQSSDVFSNGGSTTTSGSSYNVSTLDLCFDG
ncbi:hypothetical protein FA15DRAFT_635417 [Coprinopsis marcescibilis]|uniref:Transmembrane protein n=1 Tax=Coprinopsis marcescibilis TaxID=230819 RepID=A0A5C3L3F2_COPMA|nr:hypothetical protein FA15DRAFT_635417 [Coprinopsis marcescibilis]